MNYVSTLLRVGILFVALAAAENTAAESNVAANGSDGAVVVKRKAKEKVRICKPGGQQGTVFSANPLGKTDDRMKGFFYGFLLLYSFVGVSIVADMFMAAIERITSKKRRVKVPGTENRYVTTNVWNETVANLTLMALGSSAPEILLAINDIFKNRFHAGELGPSTIVGSAAFNLFVIIAVCINAIPSGETRQIKETGVFFITAVFSVFAYIWLLFIVQINSPDIVGVTEGVLTFLFFPVLVWISYASDAGILAEFFAKFVKEKKEKVVDPNAAAEGGVDTHALVNSRWGAKRWGAHRGNNEDPSEEAKAEGDSECCYCLEVLGGMFVSAIIMTCKFL